jgi:hypothetical protein
MASDLVVSLGGSSPVLAAPALGVPGLIFSPPEVPMLGVHDGTSDAVRSVRSSAELATALRAHVGSSARGERPGGHQTDPSEASTRIARALADMATSG